MSNTTALRTWKLGLGVGLVAGILDVILIYAAEPTASAWQLAQAGIAWTLFGWIVLATNSGLTPMSHCILITLLINIPWYINTSLLPARLELLFPLMIQSVVFGAMFGFAKRRLINTQTAR
ncbi:MAG: hypothetical protein L0Y80_10185 [Ignavibacteriae bacterium]|nr:hypothetical protein [Ignavibacteriota bacterium]